MGTEIQSGVDASLCRRSPKEITEQANSRGIWTAVAESSVAKRKRTATPLWMKTNHNERIQAKAASTLRSAAAVQKETEIIGRL